MYDTNLVKEHGYTIVYRRRPEDNESYWGVDTQRREISLFNVKEYEISTIERYLKQADRQYMSLYSNNNQETKEE